MPHEKRAKVIYLGQFLHEVDFPDFELDPALEHDPPWSNQPPMHIKQALQDLIDKSTGTPSGDPDKEDWRAWYFWDPGSPVRQPLYPELTRKFDPSLKYHQQRLDYIEKTQDDIDKQLLGFLNSKHPEGGVHGDRLLHQAGTKEIANKILDIKKKATPPPGTMNYLWLTWGAPNAANRATIKAGVAYRISRMVAQFMVDWGGEARKEWTKDEGYKHIEPRKDKPWYDLAQKSTLRKPEKTEDPEFNKFFSSLNDYELWALLQEVERRALIIALLGADDATKSRFYDNMSPRAKEYLLDDQTALAQGAPPTPEDIRKHQQDILKLAREIAARPDVGAPLELPEPEPARSPAETDPSKDEPSEEEWLDRGMPDPYDDDELWFPPTEWEQQPGETPITSLDSPDDPEIKGVDAPVLPGDAWGSGARSKSDNPFWDPPMEPSRTGDWGRKASRAQGKPKRNVNLLGDPKKKAPKKKVPKKKAPKKKAPKRTPKKKAPKKVAPRSAPTQVASLEDEPEWVKQFRKASRKSWEKIQRDGIPDKKENKKLKFLNTHIINEIAADAVTSNIIVEELQYAFERRRGYPGKEIVGDIANSKIIAEELQIALSNLKEDSEGEETYHYGEAEGEDDKELYDLVHRHATRAHINALKRDMAYDEEHERRRERGTHFEGNSLEPHHLARRAGKDRPGSRGRHRYGPSSNEDDMPEIDKKKKKH